MFSSLRLGKWFGINVYIHATFWLLPLFVMFQGVMNRERFDSIAFEVLMVFGVFFCVLLHEFGHVLAARAYGIGTRNVTLYPIGGVASLERMPSKPSREIAVALAGPAVNLVIAAGLYLGLMGAASLFPSLENGDPLVEFSLYLMYANVVLLVFNLLPAFPMDGGRVLRACLAMRMDRIRATTIAVGVGTVVAGGLLVAGILLPQPSLIFVAVMVYFLGQAELAMMRARDWGRDIRDRIDDYLRPRDERDERPEAPSPHGPPSPGFSGLAWDASRRAWVEWKNGVPVSSLPSGR